MKRPQSESNMLQVEHLLFLSPTNSLKSPLLVALVTSNNNNPPSLWVGILVPLRRWTNKQFKKMFKHRWKSPATQGVLKASVSTNKKISWIHKLPCILRCTLKILLVDVVKSLLDDCIKINKINAFISAAGVPQRKTDSLQISPQEHRST